MPPHHGGFLPPPGLASEGAQGQGLAPPFFAPPGAPDPAAAGPGLGQGSAPFAPPPGGFPGQPFFLPPPGATPQMTAPGGGFLHPSFQPPPGAPGFYPTPLHGGFLPPPGSAAAGQGLHHPMMGGMVPSHLVPQPTHTPMSMMAPVAPLLDLHKVVPYTPLSIHPYTPLSTHPFQYNPFNTIHPSQPPHDTPRSPDLHKVGGPQCTLLNTPPPPSIYTLSIPIPPLQCTLKYTIKYPLQNTPQYPSFRCMPAHSVSLSQHNPSYNASHNITPLTTLSTPPLSPPLLYLSPPLSPPPCTSIRCPLAPWRVSSSAPSRGGTPGSRLWTTQPYSRTKVK